MTPGAFAPRPSPGSRPGCGHVGFPTATGLNPLNLATAANSLPRVSRRTVQPRSPPLVLPRRRGFLRGGSFLSGRTLLSPPGFRLFSPPSRGAFQLSLTVLVRYRSRDVFRVGSRCLPASRRISNRRYSGSPETLRAYAYGAITLSGAAFQRTSASPPRLQRRALQHHIPWVFPPRVQFALCRFRSPLLTASLLLSFPAGTKMFQFPAFPLRGLCPGVRHKPREVPFGNPRFDGCLRLAGAYRSLPRPSSAPRAEPSTGRLSVLTPYRRGQALLGPPAYARPSSSPPIRGPWALPSRAGLGTCISSWWTGRDLNPGPPPCKGGAHTRLSYRPTKK